jgi:hypothetical protein
MRSGSDVEVEIAVQPGAREDIPESETVKLLTDTLADGPAAEHVLAVGGPTVPLVDGRFVPTDAAGRAKLNAWATVVHTVQIDERVLGSRLRWSFQGPLKVEAAAGEGHNAHYDPGSGCIQLFHFDTPDGGRFDTALARDILAHETGHAILDGLCPDLADALHPDSIAIHEAIGDVTAMVSVLGAQGIAVALAGEPFERFPAFLGDIAEGFARNTKGTRMGCLRSLGNDYRLPGGEPPPEGDYLPEDEFGIDVGPPVPTGLIDSVDPHVRSQVLSGALFAMLQTIRQHEEESAMELEPERWPEISVELAEGLFDTFGRDVLASLLYLPPGELEFTDFVATYLALDQVAWGLDDDAPRRGLISAPTPCALPELGDDWDPDDVLADDNAARRFVAAHRSVLGLPPDAPFDVLPRLRRTRDIDFQDVDEVVLKVGWERQEANPVGAPKRAIRVGTTLAFDMKRRPTLLVRARPPSDAARRARDVQLDRLRLHLGNGVDADDTGGVLRVRGTVRNLHMLGDE